MGSNILRQRSGGREDGHLQRSKPPSLINPPVAERQARSVPGRHFFYCVIVDGASAVFLGRSFGTVQ